jgi:hypothetical protein
MPTRRRFRNEKGCVGVCVGDSPQHPHIKKGRLREPPFQQIQGSTPYAAIVSLDFLAARRRANRPAAAAPKSRTIGGAGTSVPPVEPPVDPPLDEDDELEDEEELLLDEDAPEDVPPNEEDVLPPKLDEPPEDEDEPEEDELDDDEPLLEPELPDEPLEPELPEEPLEPLLPPEPP